MAEKSKEDFLKAEINKCFMELTNICIDNIITVVNPSVLQKYPTWFNDVPSNFKFESYLKSKQRQSIKSKKKESDNKSDNQVVPNIAEKRSSRSKSFINNSEDSSNTAQKSTSEDKCKRNSKESTVKKQTAKNIIFKDPKNLSQNSNTSNSSLSFELVKDTFKQKEKNTLVPKSHSIKPPEYVPPKSLINKKKKKRKIISKDPELPFAHLGGIFTINNGWDKPISEIPQNQKVIPREERYLPTIEVFAPNNEIIQDLEEAHDMFLSGSESNDCPTYDPLYDGYGELQIDLDESYHSECEVEETKTDEIARSEVNEGNSEEKKAELVIHDYEDDEISLGADVDIADLDDLDDYEPTTTLNSKEGKKQQIASFYTEVDEIVSEPSQEKENQEYKVDSTTDRVLLEAYNGICPAFLEKQCLIPNCSRSHAYVKLKDFLKYYQGVSETTRNQTYKATVRFSKLFKHYIIVFIDTAITLSNVNELSKIVKDCCAHPRTISCLRNVVDISVLRGYFNGFQAIQFILDHHEDSTAARDVILNIIIDSGPLIIQFTDYVEQVMNLQTTPHHVVNKIVESCIQYHNTQLPDICLNHLLSSPISYINQVDGMDIIKFILMMEFEKDANSNREMEIEALMTKIMNSLPNGSTDEFKELFNIY